MKYNEFNNLREKPAVEAGYSGVTPGGTKVDYANMMFRGKEIDHNSIDYEMQDLSDMMFELHGAKYIDGTELNDEELEAFEATDELQEWVRIDYVSESEVGEVAPPGREKQVKALKGKVDNPYAVAWASYNKSKGKNETGAMSSADVDRIRNQGFTDNQIKQAFRVLNHPSVKGGNMTAAYNIINRIAPGLADHPSVANALMRANEMQETRGSTLAVRTISNYADELGPDSMDYDMLKKSAEMLERGELEELGKFLHDSDTSPREYVMKVISKKDPDTFKQMYGDQEGYMSLMKPMGMEGFIGKKPEYNDFLQNKLDQAIQEYDSPEKKAERDALMQKYLNKGGKIEKVPTGKTAYKNKELKPAYRKDNGTPTTSPMSDESVEEDISEKGRVVLEKAGFDPNAIHEYMAVFNDRGRDDDATDLEDMNRNKIGVADAMAMVLASHDVQNESVEEDGGEKNGFEQVWDMASRWHEGDPDLGKGEGQGDGNYSEDMGNMIEEYNKIAAKKISVEQQIRISERFNGKANYAEVLQAEGIDPKLWLKIGKEYYGRYMKDSVEEDEGNMDLIGDGAENLGLDGNKFDYYYDQGGSGYAEVRTKSGKPILRFEYDRDGDAEVGTMDNKPIAVIKQGEKLPNPVTAKLNQIKEEGPPFGSGMELVRRALMNKWITAEEWYHLKDEWQSASDEIEQRYGDWPDGEGFGSSDHNFAIKELMGLVGYEFDEQDKGGRFIVTKMPEKLEKAGITNVRMSKDARIDQGMAKQKADAETNPKWGKDIGPVATEAGMPASIIKHKQKLAMMSDEELADRFKDFDEDKLRHMAWSHGYGKMSSHYWDRVQAGKKDDHREISRIMKYESKLADMLNQRLK